MLIQKYATKASMPINSNDAHYNIVASAIKHTLTYQGAQPTLNEIASGLNVSAYYLQQVFKEWGNLSSEQFFEFFLNPIFEPC